MIKKDLFDTNASLYVLSSLMRNPLLLQEDKYCLLKTDFCKPLQQIVFSAIYNLSQNGVEKITPQDIDIYLSQYSAQYDYYQANKGYDYITQCYQTTEGADKNQFDIYYQRLKKFSVLRDLEECGVDTTEFYDPNKDALNRDFEDEKLNKTSIEVIINKVRNKIVEVESKHVGRDNNIAQSASCNIRQLIAELAVHPEVGFSLEGDIVNFACRGARLGKLYTYSAPSGAGKTRYMVENACAISMPYLDKEGKVVLRGDSENCDYQKVLYITTEQQPDEIQTMILAHVSGVNEKAILLHNFTEEEQKRIEKGLDIIDKFGENFIIECIPDPSIALIKARLTKYIVQQNIEYIFYDYIFSSPGLLSEFRDVAVREDVALMMLSNTLKEIAATYNVFIQSATQLNDGWSKKEIGSRDQNCIRGSKAIADKIDIGLIGVRISEEEKKQINTMWSEMKAQNPNKYQHDPNIVIDIYKNRRGEMNSVKIFRYFDYGTLRCEDLFITDCSYNGLQGKEIMTLKVPENRYSFLDLKTKGVI